MRTEPVGKRDDQQRHDPGANGRTGEEHRDAPFLAAGAGTRCLRDGLG